MGFAARGVGRRRTSGSGCVPNAAVLLNSALKRLAQPKGREVANAPPGSPLLGRVAPPPTRNDHGRARPAAAEPRVDRPGGRCHCRAAAPVPPLIVLLLRRPARLLVPLAGALAGTSCDAASRRVVDPDLRLARLRSSPRWRRRNAALSAAAFPPLRRLRLLGSSSRVLCVAAGAGQAVDALRVAGIGDITGVDLVDFPPLVRQADSHNLPSFDGAFDLVLSDDPASLTGALFPSRFAGEIERTVRRGGAIALAVDRHVDLSIVASIFKKSRVVEVRNATFDGSAGSIVVILRNNGSNTNPH